MSHGYERNAANIRANYVKKYGSYRSVYSKLGAEIAMTKATLAARRTGLSFRRLANAMDDFRRDMPKVCLAIVDE